MSTNTQYPSQQTYININQQNSSPGNGIKQNYIVSNNSNLQQSECNSRIAYYKTIISTNPNRNIFKYLFPLNRKPIKTSATFNECLTDTALRKYPETNHSRDFFDIHLVKPEKSIEHNYDLKEETYPARYFRCLFGSRYFYTTAGAYGVYVASSLDISVQMKRMNYLSRKYKVKGYIIEELASAKKYHLVLGRFRQLKMAAITEGKVRKEIPKAFVVKWKKHWVLI
jgi:hypothetical protein